MQNYLFKSLRLGFRVWQPTDLVPMAAINSNEQVMRYFPSTLTVKQTQDFITKQTADFKKFGYCYYAVDLLETGALIGFIGLSYKDFESNFTPCTDIGWRLSPGFWGLGLATEGAKRCLEHAKKELKIPYIVAMAPALNEPSIRVMKNIGMKFDQDFSHSNLLDDNRLRHCVLYST